MIYFLGQIRLETSGGQNLYICESQYNLAQGAGEGGKWGDVGQKSKTPSDKTSKFWDPMYSMMLMVNNTVLHCIHILKAAESRTSMFSPGKGMVIT